MANGDNVFTRYEGYAIYEEKSKIEAFVLAFVALKIPLPSHAGKICFAFSVDDSIQVLDINEL